MAERKFEYIKTKTVKEFELSEDALDDLVTNKVAGPKFSDVIKENERNIQNAKKRTDIMLVIKNRQMITAMPFFNGNIMMLLPIPEIVTFYLNSAFSLYNQSIEILNEIKDDQGFDIGSAVLADINNPRYYQYLILRISIFTYLAIVIEYLLNKNIPATVIYNGKETTKEIIEERCSLSEKIKILNEMNVIDLSTSSNLYQRLITCYNLRSQLLHPKTTGSKFDNENVYKAYPEVLRDCGMYIETVVNLVKKINPELIEEV